MNIFSDDDDIHLCNAFEGKEFFSDTGFCFHLRWPVKKIAMLPFCQFQLLLDIYIYITPKVGGHLV